MNRPLRSVALAGFMGAGKSTLGAALAARLGRPFVDLDRALEERFGCSVAEIFARDGEAAFRRAEASLLDELSARPGQVIALGGGALLDELTRARVAERCELVCLRASVAELERRLLGDASRPLLAAPASGGLRALQRARRESYDAVFEQLDTTGRSPEGLVDELVTRGSLRAVRERAQPLWSRFAEDLTPIVLGPGALAGAGASLRLRGLAPSGVVVVSNPRVGGLYGEALEEGLRSQLGCPVRRVELPEGEQHKRLASVSELYDGFLAAGLDRRGLVISLGGGVIGDMAGFAAATFMRGLDFVQVPTSLLAMVDASVGGKTGVDLDQGKNLVGAFKPARMVIVDPTVLATLDPAEWRCGLAEAIKHGVLAGEDLLARFEPAPRLEDPAFSELLRAVVSVKVEVVAEDPFEGGRRALLNLGHTFAHAFELLSGFCLRHGEAVAVGMVAAARLGVGLGETDPGFVTRLEALLSGAGLERRLSLDPEAVVAAMARDKKWVAGRARFIVPRVPGDVVIVENPPEALVLDAVSYVSH